MDMQVNRQYNISSCNRQQPVMAKGKPIKHLPSASYNLLITSFEAIAVFKLPPYSSTFTANFFTHAQTVDIAVFYTAAGGSSKEKNHP